MLIKNFARSILPYIGQKGLFRFKGFSGEDYSITDFTGDTSWVKPDYGTATKSIKTTPAICMKLTSGTNGNENSLYYNPNGADYNCMIRAKVHNYEGAYSHVGTIHLRETDSDNLIEFRNVGGETWGSPALTKIVEGDATVIYQGSDSAKTPMGEDYELRVKVWNDILSYGIYRPDFNAFSFYRTEVDADFAALLGTMNGLGTNDATQLDAYYKEFEKKGISAMTNINFIGSSTTAGNEQTAASHGTITNVTFADGIATYTTSLNHRFVDGVQITISGLRYGVDPDFVTSPDFNGLKTVTVTGAKTFTVPIAGTPEELTDVSGSYVTYSAQMKWTNQIVNHYRDLPVVVQNNGVSGSFILDGSNSVGEQFEDRVASKYVTGARNIIFVMIGGNDIAADGTGQAEDAYETRFAEWQELIAMMIATGYEVIPMTVLPRGNNSWANVYIRGYNALIRANYPKHVDLYPLLADETGLTFNPALFDFDQLHPNNNGATVIANAIIDWIPRNL
jgi:lysophospholipase L1-like esterase